MPGRLVSGAIIFMLIVGACSSQSAGETTHTAAPDATSAVAIPTGNLSAFDRCMLAAGYEIKALRADNTGRSQYDWKLDMRRGNADEAREKANQCETLLPSPHILTDAEVADVYNLWVDEYHCLVGMGYEPTSPPSVEAFIAGWKTSVWMPIDGIDTDHWTQTQYDQAKAKCTLEFFTAEGLPQQ